MHELSRGCERRARRRRVRRARLRRGRSERQTLWEHDLGIRTPRIVVTDTRIFVAGYTVVCVEQDDLVVRGATFLLAGDELYASTNGEVTFHSAVDGTPDDEFPGKGAMCHALCRGFASGNGASLSGRSRRTTVPVLPTRGSGELGATASSGMLAVALRRAVCI
jgi:hypothetical protein